MTDLQVKHQALMLEREKLNEEKRLHDAQIHQYVASGDKLQAEASKVAHEVIQVDANTRKLLAEAQLTERDIAWYYDKTIAQISNLYASGSGSILKGIGSIIPL